MDLQHGMIPGTDPSRFHLLTNIQIADILPHLDLSNALNLTKEQFEGIDFAQNSRDIANLLKCNRDSYKYITKVQLETAKKHGIHLYMQPEEHNELAKRLNLSDKEIKDLI